MSSLLDRHPNAVQLALVVGGYLLALVYGRQIDTLTPRLEPIPTYVSPQLYDWSTVQFGLALIAVGIALSNRSLLHRVRTLRLSHRQRLAAFACAFALMSPWITAITAGLALDFGAPFTTLWLAAFLLGSAGGVGLLFVGLWRVSQVYGTTSDRFPYVGVRPSRRRAIRDGGLALLGAGAVATSFAAGRVTLGESWPEYHGTAPVIYERDDLRVQAVEDPVRLGESITFEITNIADGSVTLGCNNPWALQAYEAGGWHHVTWTAGRYYQLCVTSLGAGETTTETVPLSEDAITSKRSPLTDPARELTPGTYRFVLLGPRPYLAVNFQVLPRR